MSDLQLLGSMIESIEGVRGSFPEVTKQLELFKPLYEVASTYIEAKNASMPAMGDFGTFCQESNMDVSFGPALLSTFTHQNSFPGGSCESEQPFVGSSILDVWSEMDFAQFDPSSMNPGI